MSRLILLFFSSPLKLSNKNEAVNKDSRLLLQRLLNSKDKEFKLLVSKLMNSTKENEQHFSDRNNTQYNGGHKTSQVSIGTDKPKGVDEKVSKNVVTEKEGEKDEGEEELQQQKEENEVENEEENKEENDKERDEEEIAEENEDKNEEENEEENKEENEEENPETTERKETVRPLTSKIHEINWINKTIDTATHTDGSTETVGISSQRTSVAFQPEKIYTNFRTKHSTKQMKHVDTSSIPKQLYSTTVSAISQNKTDINKQLETTMKSQLSVLSSTPYPTTSERVRVKTDKINISDRTTQSPPPVRVPTGSTINLTSTKNTVSSLSQSSPITTKTSTVSLLKSDTALITPQKYSKIIELTSPRRAHTVATEIPNDSTTINTTINTSTSVSSLKTLTPVLSFSRGIGSNENLLKEQKDPCTINR